MAWTDDKKAEVIKAYEAAEPTPETSIEIVNALSEAHGESSNGIRMILTKAGVYIKKTQAATAKAGGTAKEGASKRVSKEDSINSLRNAITEAGQEVDEDVIVKLTGKAAVYFAGVITAINPSNDEAISDS